MFLSGTKLWQTCLHVPPMSFLLVCVVAIAVNEPSLEIVARNWARFDVQLSPILFLKISRGHFSFVRLAKICQALTGFEGELALVNNFLPPDPKSLKKKLSFDASFVEIHPVFEE